MKPILFKHAEAATGSFFVLNDKGHYFYDALHYHPLYQLTAIVEGAGTVFIADHINRFKPGDVFIIGPNLPHVFRCDNEYYKKGSTLEVNAAQVYFTQTSLGETFFDLPESLKIKSFLAWAKFGIKMNGHHTKQIFRKIVSMLDAKGVQKITTFLLALEEMADLDKEEKTILTSAGYLGSVMDEENDRMSKVFDFIMNHFTERVKLKQVSDVACMTTNAFCRFFKKRTKKSLVEFITEIRVGYACKLLQEEKFSVAQAAYNSGFNNISNFNRQFKKITALTPIEYTSAFNKS